MLVVHQGKSPGEPMKTGMELVKEWEGRATAVHPINEEQAADFHFKMGLRYCAATLQAWLREADEWVLEGNDDRESLRAIWTENIREDLLGTTREGK